MKNKGNSALKDGKAEEAVLFYTDAINLEPNNHVLYSNRSAAYCTLKKYNEAVRDAEKTVELKPDWPKVLHTKVDLINYKLIIGVFQIRRGSDISGAFWRCRGSIS